jgi:hypothetical protein
MAMENPWSVFQYNDAGLVVSISKQGEYSSFEKVIESRSRIPRSFAAG